MFKDSYLVIKENTVYLRFHCFNRAVYLHNMNIEGKKTKRDANLIG